MGENEETSTDLAIENEIVLEEEDSAPVIIENFNDVNEDGSYTFGYKASDGTFKKETRDLEGNVKGMYGFLDDNGEVQVVEYASNNATGFKILSGNPAPVAPEVPKPLPSNLNRFNSTNNSWPPSRRNSSLSFRR